MFFFLYTKDDMKHAQLKFEGKCEDYYVYL